MAWYDSWFTGITTAPPGPPTLSYWQALFTALKDLAIESLASTDTTTGNASTAKHGLLQKLTGVTTHFCRADGVWAPVLIATTFEISISGRELALNVLTPLAMGGDGADLGHERLTNGFERWFVQFGYTTAQYACAEVLLPDGYTDSSLTITADWETESSTLGTCVLNVYGELIDDNDLSSVALTSPIATVTDTNNGAGRRNVSTATAINPAGSGNRLMLRITRDYGTDTIEDDIKIIGLCIKGTKVITS